MITAFSILLFCQLAGELLARLLPLKVPGPVLGMLLLFVLLLVRRSALDAVRDTAQGLLRNLSVLFVPAAVGVMVHFGRLRAEWFAVAVAVVLSTALTLGVTALVFAFAARLVDPEKR